MMPGVNQSGAGGIASEATSGTCQNCTVLNQSLDEYVAALLTLKQKIIDTDLLLCEYKEKCDELQKSQRESAKLHKELDEVLLKLGPLEKQTAEYEAVRAELEETKAALKECQAKSEKVDCLRDENAKALAMNSKLEEAVKKAEDVAHTQSLENTKLRSEKEMLESDLQRTQESLRLSEQAVEELENLKLQNAKALILKSNLENQLLALEDMNLKQNQTIQDLKSKNTSLEKSMRSVEEKLVTLEKEFNKETRCSSTQTENQTKVDKAKIWSLLQEVWHCVDPLSKTPENLDLNDNQRLMFRPPPCPLPISPVRNSVPQLTVSTPKGAKVSPGKSRSESSLASACSPSKEQKKKKISRKKKRSLESVDEDESCAKTDDVSDLSLNKDGPDEHLLERGTCSKSPDVWEILSLSWPLPAPLSPLPPDDLAEMEVDTSLKEGSNSEAEDGQKSQSTELEPLKDSVAVSSVCLSPGNQLSMGTSSITPDTDNKSPQKGSTESQEMQEENKCKIEGNTEDSPSTPATAGLHNESDKEQVNLTQATIIPAESQLGNKKEHTNQTISTQQCNGGHEVPKANCNDGVREVSEPVQQLIISEKCKDEKDESVQHQSEVKANLPGYSSLTPDTCTMTERTVEEIQSVPALKMVEGQNGYGGQDGESSCSKMNGVTSGDSSEDEEFLGLKRKVRGIGLRPADLDSVGSNGKQEPVAHVQGTICEAKEEHLQPEDEKDNEFVKDDSITMNMCKPVVLEDSAGVDIEQETGQTKENTHESENYPNHSVPILDEHNKQEESETFSPNIENMDGDVKEDGAVPNDPSVKSQYICPASSINTPPLSSLVKSLNLPLSDVAFRNALASSQSPESIGKVLTEMGPPLPPVLLPLTATPPKFRKHLTPNRPTIQLPTWSSTEGPFSLKQQSKEQSPDPGLQEEVKSSLSMTTPSPSRGVPSSPLQFGSATPKHALPVPGRLPSSALNSPSPVSQENSMQILDTMYPELSAQARTLNILRGNVNLGRSANENGASPPSVNPISGNKTINSSSTAFTKTDQKAKRIGANVLLPKSAKRLRLDTCSPDPARLTPPVQPVSDDKPSNGVASPKSCPANGPSSNSETARKEGETVDDISDAQSPIISAFEKLNNSNFDVLPVIRSHVFLGRISEVPVLRDEEKCVISDFCLKQSTAEEFMLAILSKIKLERAVMKHELLQSLCRVYVGLCRWAGDCQRAHALAYSLLKEDFPEAPKLVLFMVTTWPTILSHDSLLCRAINVVSKLRAEGEILDYLNKYLHWDERPPGDLHEMVTTTLKALLEDGTLMFQKQDRHGYDLCPAAWDYIFSLDLLCAHLGWKWTHDNIVGKELWPVMNAWVSQPRPQQTPVRDICVAAVLRLIGRLGQLGLKEKLCMSVQNVAKAINLFGKHGISEGVPWEVQLAAVYAIYDLSPSNPKDALEALASWRGEITQPVPPAITSCITQIGSICRQIRP
ncbi:little elongation complex subunit 1 [Hemibagrus wyckioides]|uniref:little elongation complex subunit 1 n=1 Tax=Hemibagrus wyckioides TaxID=337641 RepID=UPI00266C0DE8|nr:little elongation complex subunit 1 [Hemibagrus wyckioides]